MTIRHFCIFAIIGVLLTLPSAASAADLDVKCSASALIDAINNANQNTDADTLFLKESCIYSLDSVDNKTNGNNGLPSVSTEIDIHGNGAVITRSCEQNVPPFRIFHVAESGNLEIDRLTIRNGWAYNETSCELDSWGGGIINAGILTTTESVIGSNQACHGGGIYSTGSATLINSLLSDNTAYVGELPDQLNFGRGGAIYASNGKLELVSSIIRYNSAFVHGGGVYNGNNSEVAMTGSTVSGNTAGKHGGGVFNLLSNSTEILSINRSLISANTAGTRGGGIYNAPNHNIDIVNSTVSSNQAQNGGGIYSEGGGGIRLVSSTVTNNSATERTGGVYNGWSSVVNTSTVTMTNTIVAAQALGSDCTYSTGVVSAGHNLDSDGSCVTDGIKSDMTNSTPDLGKLRDNGGQSLTHALLDQSLAIDHGNDSECPMTDQRGVSRPQGAHCDIGSFEYGSTLTGSSPVLRINESTGAPGSIFILTGRKFPPSAMISISVNEIDMYILYSDQKGVLRFNLDTLGADPGKYKVSAGAATSASRSFLLDPESPLQQSSSQGPTLRLPCGSAIVDDMDLYLPMMTR